MRRPQSALGTAAQCVAVVRSRLRSSPCRGLFALRHPPRSTLARMQRMNGFPSTVLSTAAAPLARLLGEFLRFGVVGTVGFVVDAAVLMAAIALGLGPWLGRVLSYLLGATTTFGLN